MSAARKHASEWLPGYQWPVKTAHAEFLKYGYFSDGSLFHSAQAAYVTANVSGHSLQVHKSVGTSAANAETANRAAACDCTLFLDRKPIFRAIIRNSEALALLKNGDIETFIRTHR